MDIIVCVCVFRGGFFHTHGYDPVLAMLLFSGALVLHCRQLDLKLRLDYLWATQVSLCVSVSILQSAKILRFTRSKMMHRTV